MDDSCAVVARHKSAGTLLNADQKISDEVLNDLGDRRLLGPARRPRVWRNRRVVFLLRRIPRANGHARSDDRGSRVRPRLHRRRRSRHLVRHRRTKTPLPAAARVRRTPFGVSHLPNLAPVPISPPCEPPPSAKATSSSSPAKSSSSPTSRPAASSASSASSKASRRCSWSIYRAQENEQFQLKKYGLYALRHTYNRGIIFNGLRVPADNLLHPKAGNGLTIAYHGLNRGRVALCANAAGTMRSDARRHAPLGAISQDLRRNDQHSRTRSAPRRSHGGTHRRLRCPHCLVRAACSTRAIAAKWSASSPRSSAASRSRKRRSNST